MELYEHNQKAYEKVMEAFKTKQRAAIVHATGTGKSYIIAAVANNFNRVCVIAPNDFILNETKKVCKASVIFKTYQSFLFKDTDKNSYDLIVLDEFHRAGACKWGDAIDKLIEANPYAKLLGTSATHIRYLDDNRNMADELFDGNVVSTITLLDAINMGILQKPIYISSLYSIDESVMMYQKRINDKIGATQEWKDKQVNRLFGITTNWENAHGASHVIAKYLPKDTKRIIIFFSRVEEADKMKSIIGRWFAMAGFSKLRFYSLDYTERYLNKEMESFKKDEDCLKIALSVNMLNEGVHIPNVDSIMMLRTTSSRIITEQQIGRCMSSGKTNRPVIFDFVNNIDLINEEPNFSFDFEGNGGGEKKKKNKKSGHKFPFDIIDDCRDIRELFNSIYNETGRTKWAFVKSVIQDFYDRNGRFLQYADNKSLYNSFLSFYRNDIEDCREWSKSLGYEQKESYIGSIDERITWFDETLKRIGFIPSKWKKENMLQDIDQHVLSLYYTNRKYILRNGTPEEIERMNNIVNKYRETTVKSKEYCNEARKIISELGYLPSTSASYQYIHDKIRLGTLTDEELELVKKYNIGSRKNIGLSVRQKNLMEFILDKKRTPRNAESKSMYTAMLDLERRHGRLNEDQEQLYNLIKQYKIDYTHMNLEQLRSL